MEIKNNQNDLITPIDTSARDFAFEADYEKTRRQMEQRDRIMNKPIDITAQELALKAELERAKRELEAQQAMYQDIGQPHKHR